MINMGQFALMGDAYGPQVAVTIGEAISATGAVLVTPLGGTTPLMVSPAMLRPIDMLTRPAGRFGSFGAR